MRALLVVDLINDFAHPNGALYVEATREVIPNVREAVNYFRKNGIVIYVNDAHDSNDPEFNLWPEHAVKGTWGAKVIYKLEPSPGDIIVEKQTYNGFYNTPLENVLAGYWKSLKEKGFQENRIIVVNNENFEEYKDLERADPVKEVYITGTVTNICVLAATMGSVVRGLKYRWETYVIRECVAALDNKDNKYFIERQADLLGAKVVGLDEVLNKIQ